MGLNWFNVYVKVLKGFGGVGLFIKKYLCKNYKVDIIDNLFDGILGVKFMNKFLDYVFVVFFCYLLFESLLWGRDVLFFFFYLFI